MTIFHVFVGGFFLNNKNSLMLSAANGSLMVSPVYFCLLLSGTYADVVKIKPQIVVLSNSHEENHGGRDAPCAGYTTACSENTGQQDNWNNV